MPTLATTDLVHSTAPGDQTADVHGVDAGIVLPLFASTTGLLECGCSFDQHGLVDEDDWRECAHHDGPVRVVRAHPYLPATQAVVGGGAGGDSAHPLSRVRVLLNSDPQATWFGYRPGVVLYPALEYLADGDDHMWLCEQAFQAGTYDGPITADPADGRAAAADFEETYERLIDRHTRQLAAAYRRAARRSVSVGDVVAVDDAFYAVAGLGYERIDAPFVATGIVPVPVAPALSYADAVARRRLPHLLDTPA